MVRRSDQEVKTSVSFDQLFSFPLKQQILNWKTVRNRPGEEFNTIPWSKIYYNLYLHIEYQNSLGWKGYRELIWSISLLKESPNRAGCSFGFWILSRMESQQPLWATCFNDCSHGDIYFFSLYWKVHSLAASPTKGSKLKASISRAFWIVHSKYSQIGGHFTNQHKRVFSA